MRLSTDQLAGDGTIQNGFDYQLQVWVHNGAVLRCGHPERMGSTCCNGRIYAGRAVVSIPGHETRGTTQ